MTMNPSNLDASKSVCVIAKARLAKGLHVSDGDVAQLVAEIERLQSQVKEWQPIETAPKDGRAVLLLCIPFKGASPEIISAYWDGKVRRRPNGAWMLVQYGSYAEDHDIDGSPTHWMPLPEPPQ